MATTKTKTAADKAAEKAAAAKKAAADKKAAAKEAAELKAAVKAAAAKETAEIAASEKRKNIHRYDGTQKSLAEVTRSKFFRNISMSDEQAWIQTVDGKKEVKKGEYVSVLKTGLEVTDKEGKKIR